MSEDVKPQSKWVKFWNGGGWWKALLLAVVYIVLYELPGFAIVPLSNGAINTSNILGDPLSVFLGVALPVIIGSVILLVFARSIGWLPKPLFAKQPIKGKWWMWIAVVLVGATILLRLLGIDYGAYATGVVATVFLAGIFIGLSEELLTRGLVVNLLRKKGYGEWVVMVLSSLIFALLHSVNAFTGQEGIVVISTIGFAFGFGIMMYLTLRVTGNLIYPIILHALTDPTTMLATGGIDMSNGANTSPFVEIAGLSTMAFLAFALIAMIFVRGKAKTSDKVTTE